MPVRGVQGACEEDERIAGSKGRATKQLSQAEKRRIPGTTRDIRAECCMYIFSSKCHDKTITASITINVYLDRASLGKLNSRLYLYSTSYHYPSGITTTVHHNLGFVFSSAAWSLNCFLS